jgi:hypothetical protein
MSDSYARLPRVFHLIDENGTVEVWRNVTAY